VFQVFHVFRVNAETQTPKTKNTFTSIPFFNGTLGTLIKTTTYLEQIAFCLEQLGTSQNIAPIMQASTRIMHHESCPMESFMAILAFYEHSSAG